MDLDGSAYPIVFLYIPYEKGFLLVPFVSKVSGSQKAGGLAKPDKARSC